MGHKRQIIVGIALIKNHEGKILLQKRIDPLVPAAHGKWEFPGGRIDYGELPEKAIVRECQEEIGCTIKIKRLLPHVGSTVWQRSDDKEQHVLVVCYEAEIAEGEPRPLDKKVAEVKWYTKRETDSLDTLANIQDFIDSLDK